MEGKIKVRIGKYQCRCDYKVIGLTESAKEQFNKLLSKEENKNDEK